MRPDEWSRLSALTADFRLSLSNAEAGDLSYEDAETLDNLHDFVSIVEHVLSDHENAGAVGLTDLEHRWNIAMGRFWAGSEYINDPERIAARIEQQQEMRTSLRSTVAQLRRDLAKKDTLLEDTRVSLDRIANWAWFDRKNTPIGNVGHLIMIETEAEECLGKIRGR